MSKPNFANRTLFHGDNLDFLQGMNSATVDLIATDPPFNKGKDFHATPDSLAAGGRFQDRWSWERDVQQAWIDAIKDDHPQIHSLINHVIGGLDNDPKARRKRGGQEDMAAFLCFIAVRLIQMRRVLKNTGSIYLHCDPTASHYLKALMDALFGARNFRNEIVWLRKQGEKHNLARKRMPAAHDIILFYVKSPTAQYRPQYTPYSPEYIQKNYNRRDHRGAYSTFPCTNDAGGNKPYTFRGITRAWRFKPETMQEMFDAGMLTQASPSSPFRYKKYLDQDAGVKIEDCWLDIPQVRARPEKTDYPTQKPLALYERIIKASSSEGDIVLDPFCGCATTPIAAERLRRQWVGMDLWDGAHQCVQQRIEDNRQLLHDPNPQITYTTKPPTRDDDSDNKAEPTFELRLKLQRPAERWQKLSHNQIRDMLAAAQDSGSGLVDCAGCGRSLEPEFMELDHLNPRSQGGENWITNRILLCSPCNRRKSDGLTLKGLLNQNRKANWMKNRAAAIRARDRAAIAASRVRDQP